MRLSQQLSGTSSILDATAAITNWRALLLLATTIFSAILLGYLFALTGNGPAIFLGSILSLTVMFYGGNAVGIMLMDAAQGESSRPIVEAIMASLFTSHRLLLVALTAVVAMLIVLLVISLLLLVCKIPGLGPLLLALVIPLSALAFGISLFTLIYVFYPLAAAAVWSGSDTRTAIICLLTIARKRLVLVVIKDVLLMLLVGLIAIVIGGIVFSGLSTVDGMAFSIIGGDMNPGMGLMGLWFSMAGMGGSGMDGVSGYLIAGVLGSVLLMVSAMMIPGLIAMQGFCQIYISSLEGLDISETERDVERHQQQLVQKRQEMQARLEERRMRSAASAAEKTPQTNPTAGLQQTTAPDTTPEAEAKNQCPQCHTELEEDEGKFCGQCGHQLR
jgi:hypothetical protein